MLEKNTASNKKTIHAIHAGKNTAANKKAIHAIQ